MEGAATGNEPLVSCPVCARELPAPGINAHLDRCLQGKGGDGSSPAGLQQPCKKKMRLSTSPEGGGNRGEEPGGSLSPPPMFPLFQKGSGSGARASPARDRGEEKPRGEEDPGPPALGGESLAQKLEGTPLADKLRPDTLGDYVGQDQVVGEQTLLRPLLEAHEIPSLILWGPPGCGKTTLAHIVAKGSKKKGTRFVTLSATSAKTNEVREVISQAQNEKRLFKRKTILFIDEIHRFNKSQQDTFLPHVECGTVTLIGATTENPSFQVNAALLSRCRVLVLEKLSVEAMEAILTRALQSLGIRILNPEEQHAGSVNGSNSKTSESGMCIEKRAVSTLAYLCDGDARTGLNGLQMAVQAQLTQLPHQSSMLSSSANRIVITEDHVKEGLQRSHILYDRA
ncbi:PREDICTED: ATPase WRNIP1-like, partial [Gekko japonicus]|uniref:ATPase WRNIP1-like n=1 Tax=Gekko japonicus TaxID=146911 RepID=A0ABM1L8G7_GEKJA